MEVDHGSAPLFTLEAMMAEMVAQAAAGDGLWSACKGVACGGGAARTTADSGAFSFPAGAQPTKGNETARFF